MKQNENNKRIDYIEFSAKDINKAKKFYNEIFGWDFTDYGPDYISFNDGRISGGFYKANEIKKGGPLIVLYSTRLEEVLNEVKNAGGKITKEIFEFPGGKRFHFEDPNGHELAIWSDK